MQDIFRKYNKIFFALVALLLIYPVFRSGYIFLLDWPVLPFVSPGDIDWQIDSIGWIAYKLAASVLGFGIVQRLVVFAIIFFAGTAGFRLAKGTDNLFARYFAGLFLIFNPFFYARLVEQPNIAAGSVLLFWFLAYFLEYLEERRWKKLLIGALLAAFSVSFLKHGLFFVAVSVGMLCLVDYLKNRDWKFILKSVGTLALIIVVLNSNWIFHLVTGGEKGIGGIRKFSQSDVQTFKTRSVGGDSVYTTVASLQGYWGEKQNRFVSVQESPFGKIFWGAILSLVLVGLWRLRKDVFRGIALAVIWLAAFALAVGVSSPLLAPAAFWLYDHIPFYAGLREPHKWVILLVFGYALWGSWGAKTLTEWLAGKRIFPSAGVLLVLLPIFFCFPMLRGVPAQLAPHEFPPEWQAAKKYLASAGSEEKILFLPWHSYLELNFAGKNVNNPAANFFGKNVIQGNNTEFGEVYSHADDPQTLTVEKYITRKNYPAQKISYIGFPEDMRGLGVAKVILAKTDDWSDYAWLAALDLEKVMENSELIIYSIR